MTKINLKRSNIDSNFPLCRPSLDLNFTQSQLDERITFTRSTSGSRVNQNRLIEYVPTNQPRFDHDPITSECKGLIVENSSTNYFANSIISNPAWSYVSLDLSLNATTSPDGTNTATLLTATAKDNQSRVENAGDRIAGITYTHSCFCKAGTSNYVTFGIYQTTSGIVNTQVIFNLSGSGSVTYTGGSLTAFIIPYANGWYRCIMTTTLVSGTYSGSSWKIGVCNNPSTYYTANIGDSIYVWGAQLERSGYYTSYIPTSGSQFTRGGDLASMSGTNFSSWYNQTEGTVISNYIINVPPTSSSNHADFAIFNADSSNRIVGWSNDSKVALISVIKNNITIFLPVDNIFGNTTYIPIKKAVSLKDKDMRACANGILYGVGVITQNYQQLLANDFTYMYLGAEGVFASALSGTIARFTYYPKALSPNQLQLLTQ